MTRRGRQGTEAYTLIEMLIALTMFAVITVATGLVLNGAIRAHESTQARIDEATELRALFGTLGRDLRAVYTVASGPNSYFVAPGSGSGTILTFTTLASRIKPDSSTTACGPTGGTQASQPQSDVWLVSYVYNQETGVLSRCVTTVPNPDTIPQDESLLTEVARGIRSIQVNFPDPVNGDRSDWNYMVDTSATAGSGSTGTSTSTSTTSTQTTDTTLPSAVQVTIVRDSKAGPPVTQTFTVALMNSTPQPAGQKPATTTTATTSGASATSASKAYGLPGLRGLGWPVF
jgi:type II secretory pathway pseudopilin PulG